LRRGTGKLVEKAEFHRRLDEWLYVSCTSSLPAPVLLPANHT
jgi:hypothetical protein